MEPSFEAKVLEVRPNANYRGISYDQEVVLVPCRENPQPTSVGR